MRRKILVFTGAGVSAESGVKTFRDNDGLWNSFKVEDVATISSWRKNPSMMIEFYNMRKNELINVTPNDGHKIIADLEDYFEVLVVTQNVDDLHEKAGSNNIIHLHGEISKIRSSKNPNIKKDYIKDLNIGDLCPEGSQWRPDVIWFGEDLDNENLLKIEKFAKNADVCIIVGTSMTVSPANEIPFWTKKTSLIYYVDPSQLSFNIPYDRREFFTHIEKIGSDGMIDVISDLRDIFL